MIDCTPIQITNDERSRNSTIGKEPITREMGLRSWIRTEPRARPPGSDPARPQALGPNGPPWP